MISLLNMHKFRVITRDFFEKILEPAIYPREEMARLTSDHLWMMVKGVRVEGSKE